MRTQFTFYRSFREAIKCLPDEDRLKVYDAIADYALDEEEPDITGAAMAVFLMARPTLDNSRKKAESGSTGGTNGTGDSKQRTSTSQANRKQTASTTQANDKQTASKKEIEIEIEKDITPYSPPKGDAEFEEFWALYPKKVGKIAAKKAFQKARKTTSLETLLTAVRVQKCGSRWSKDNGDFIPNPATWLNQGRWEDEDTPGKAQNSRPGAIAADLDRMEDYLKELTG